ncbi:hypothetical protein KIW84_065326 [Lathyrus oleraceus]|uniref:Uncharacterized protein n=1 Tax=Pisum sativum TaxID=3888 RepID=A0A9D4WCP0_PEA|nr:hypothetical protein KIW84_065326 [Pisum sativum]
MEENLGEEEKEDLKEVHVRLWEAFENSNLDKHNNNSYSDDDDEDYMIDEFYWEKEINFGYKARNNVLNFPREVTKKCLYWNQNAVKFIDDDTGKSYYGEVHCAKRNKKIAKKEKFIGCGWYEYVKNKKLRRGDELGFSIGNPLDKLEENLGEEEKEDLKEVHVRLWEAFEDPNLDKHNNNSDSDDDDEDYMIDEFYWEKEISFGYKDRNNVLVRVNRKK